MFSLTKCCYCFLKSVYSPIQSSLKPNENTFTSVIVLCLVIIFSHGGICFIYKQVLSLLCLLNDLIGDLYVKYWDGTPSTTVKLTHSLHCQDSSLISYCWKQMYCFVENSTSSAYLLVCKLSDYHQYKKNLTIPPLQT